MNVKNADGENSLILATKNGHIEIVRFLIESSVDIESRTKDRSTPLILAVEAGHAKMVELLISKGADLEAKRLDNHTGPHSKKIIGIS